MKAFCEAVAGDLLEHPPLQHAPRHAAGGCAHQQADPEAEQRQQHHSDEHRVADRAGDGLRRVLHLPQNGQHEQDDRPDRDDHHRAVQKRAP